MKIKIKQSNLLSIILMLSMVFTMLFMNCGMVSAETETEAESSVESISVLTPEPIELIEETGGEWMEDQNSNKYYYYSNSYIMDKIRVKGTVLTVNGKDGDSKEYAYAWIDGEGHCFQSEDGEIIPLNYADGVRITNNQYANHWEKGKTNTLEVTYMGKTAEVQVSIIENPVESISISLAKSIELVEETGGAWRRDQNGNQYYVYYDGAIIDKIAVKGTVLTINGKDGRSKEYTYNWIDGEGRCFQGEDGEIILWDYYDGFWLNADQYANHWEKGKTNTLEVTYMGKTAEVQVSIIENPVESISISLAKPVELVEEIGGYWEEGPNGNQYYFYYNDAILKEILVNGTVLTINGKDGSSKEYTYAWIDGEGRCFQGEDGEIIPWDYYDGFWLNAEKQAMNHWEKGKTNTLEVTYMGKTAEVQVSIIENPVESISISLAKPIELIEETDGYWREDQNGSQYYYYYDGSIIDKIAVKGTVVTINGKDGKSKEYTYAWIDGQGRCFQGEDGEIIPWDYYDGFWLNVDNQATNHWEKGKTNSLEVTYMGKTAEVQVSIIENPVESISISLAKPIELVEESGGSWKEDGTGNSFYYYNAGIVRTKIMEAGTVLTVNEKDGGSKEYVCTWVDGQGECFQSEDGDIISCNDYDGLWLNAEKQVSNHWEKGKTNTLEVTYMGKTAEVQVSIIENPVESISISLAKPIELIEESGGSCEKTEKGEDFYFYNAGLLMAKFMEEGAVLTVDDKDEGSREYVCTWVDGEGKCFQDKDGNVIPWGYPDGFELNTDKQFTTPWKLGNTNTLEIVYMGKKAEIPITIVENPVESISISLPEPIKLVEETEGNWYENQIMRKLASTKAVLTVNEKGGSCKEYTCRGHHFESKDGDGIYWDINDGFGFITDNQDSNSWKPGNAYTLEIVYMGKTAEIPITVVENPVESISISLPKPVELVEETGGYWEEDQNGNQYYFYYNDAILEKYLVNGTVLTVNEKDGGSKEYVCTWVDGQGTCFQSEDGDIIPWDRYAGYWLNMEKQISNHWERGKTNTLEIVYLGKKAEIPITIVENPVESISISLAKPIELIQESGGSWEEDENGKDYFYYNNDLIMNRIMVDGTVLTVNGKDSSSKEYTCTWIAGRGQCFQSKDGDIISWGYYDGFWFNLDNQAMNHWELGKKNTLEIVYMGKTTKVPVSIVKKTDNPSSDDGNSFIPADNVTNSGATGTDSATTTADINTTVSGSTASATVDKTTADKIVDKANSNQSTKVIVDVTTSTGTAENTTVTLPTDTLQKIAEKTEANVTVKTDVAEVTLDQKAVEAVASKATGSDVKIIVEKIKDETKEMEFRLKIVSNGVVISEFDGGEVTVTVKLNTELAGEKDSALTCVYIDDNGIYRKIGGVKNNDGTYTFIATHL